ncbi:protein-L-isoaspartate O-methyltransferase [Sphingomonas cynarae]|uniref:Protein-L-isoaspartate O-methyltransferase n=1 Tax=Sphingomonas cynarae TaxID=930197 RepID=A0ABP7E7V4_9SPHN
MTTISTSAAADTAVFRQAMVASQLRPNDVNDARVVTAMATIAREDFVPGTAPDLAYRDRALPLGGGRFQNPPLATARLLTEAEIVREDRVLLIGAATGYTATILAQLGARVTAVESDPALVAIARATLADVPGVELVEGAMAAGHPAGAPYDVLLIDGAIDELPTALLEQLRVDGRIAMGIAQNGVTRLAVGRRTAGGHAAVPFADSECVVLPGFLRPAAFRF